MPTTWAPTAYWMTVYDGVPRRHATRTQAIEYATLVKCLAFRQDVATGRIDVIYEPVSGTTLKAGQLPIARKGVS